MRSDFYSLPYAARRAIRRGEYARDEAERHAMTIAELRAMNESLEQRVKVLTEALIEARPYIANTMVCQDDLATIFKIDAALADKGEG